ncbi:MAG: Ig-like domain-containing protein, partial [Ilumatobacteraceae bacterium]
STTDGAGNVGSDTQALDVDTTLPLVSIDGGTVAATNDLTPTVSGDTDVAAGQPVALTLTRTANPLTLTRAALVQGDQTWSISPNGLTAGIWTIIARVADPAGNETTDTQTLTIDTTAPIAAITSSALTNNPTPTITGTTEAGAVVAVSIDGLAVSGIVQGTAWSATTTVALGHGTHNVSVTATDTAGNSTVLAQTLTVDLVLPVISINPGATNSTNDSTPTIAGTTDVAVGVTVHVTIDGGAPLAALVQSDGWNITPSVALSAGEHTIVATVIDPAGNIGTATQILTIDTTKPTVIIDGGPSRTTADATPAITGSSPDVPVGSNVTVEVAGQTLTTSISAGGTYSVTAASITPNSTYFVFVTVTDAAGNVGNANQSLTISAVAPTVIYTNGPTAATNDSTPLISGTSNAPIGSPAVVSVGSQTLNATIQPGGSWNVTAAALVNGTYVVSTSITDPDGNVGTATQTLVVDSTTPTSITITGGASAATNDDTPTISGVTDAADGRIITVAIAGQTMTSSAIAGTWSVTAAHIADGTYAATATVSAVGGNHGSATQLLTIDTVDPVVVIGGGDGTVQTTDPTPDISGSGVTPGSTVTVTVDGQTMTTTVAADGTWSVTPPNPLPAGDNPVTVTITDPAGNTGTGTQTITVIAVATTITITGGASVTTNDNTPTISGTTNAADGRVLTVTVSTQTLTTSVIGGVWSVDAANLANGTYNVTASVSVSDGTPAASAQSLTIAAVVTPPAAGYTSVGPKRVFDTRPGSSTNALRTVLKQQVVGAYVLEVKMTDLAGYVPADGVGAVSLNVTATRSTAAGYITVYACGVREEVSSVNFPAGGTVANAVIAPVSASGTVCFYSYSATDIVVDVNGWFAAGAAFNGVGPKRVFDTRAGESPTALRDVPKAKQAANTMLEVKLTDLAGYVPANGVDSVSLNVVVTNPEAPGFITVYSCGTRKAVSSVNYVAGQTVANAVIAPVSATGTVCFYTFATTDIIVDINGWIASGSSFHGVSPGRVLDTRTGFSPDALR